ncbi:MAG: discoidin domain-containing protein, partial [Polaribacter sp.]
HTRPPLLTLSRTVDGQVTIVPKQHAFGWKPHGGNAVKNINSGMEIVYTVDGSTPSVTSTKFKKPFFMAAGVVKAMAVISKKQGSVVLRKFGIIKKKWKIIDTDSAVKKHTAEMAIDADLHSYWQSEATGKHYVSIDLGTEVALTGFSYTPPTNYKKGMVEEGVLKISADGKVWKPVESFKFGNLINNPTSRKYTFAATIKTRFVQIVPKVIAGTGKAAAIAELDFFIN